MRDTKGEKRAKECWGGEGGKKVSVLEMQHTLFFSFNNNNQVIKL